MPLDELIWSRDEHGNLHDLEVAVHPGRRVAIADGAMTRIMGTDAALELVFALLKAVEKAKGPAPSPDRA